MAKSHVHVAVKEVDHGWAKLREMVRTLKNANSYVKVGVLDGGKGDDKRGRLTNAELAAVHEFGTRDNKIPARPFVSTTFEQNRDKYIEDLRVLVKGIYEQKITIDRALGLMGAKMSADVKKYVTVGAGVPPPNADSTTLRKLLKGSWKAVSQKVKQKKGEDGPEIEVTGTANVRTLIDTSRMIGAVTWSVIIQGKDEGGGS